MSKKVGLFGGTFNPVHKGHFNSVEQVTKKLGLEKVIVIPTSTSPLRVEEDVAEEKHRLEMVKLAFSDLNFVEVSTLEFERGGISFTIDTINFLKQTHPEYDIYLIVGFDQFLAFHQWKNFDQILQKVNLVVTSRPGHDLVEDLDSIDIEVKNKVTQFSGNEWHLETGKKIFMIQLEDVDVSASEIRKKLRTGENVGQMLKTEVKDYIEREKIYQPIKELLEDYESFTLFCAQVLQDGKAINVIAKDLRGEDKPTEFALIASGTSRKHAMALAEQVARQVKTEFKVTPINIDGRIEGQWIVLDYGSLMVHVFYDFTRQEYQLEKLWSSSKDLSLDLK